MRIVGDTLFYNVLITCVMCSIYHRQMLPLVCLDLIKFFHSLILEMAVLYSGVYQEIV